MLEDTNSLDGAHIINVHLVNINVFVKFYEIPLCLFKILKNQNAADGQMDGRPDQQMYNVKTVYPTYAVCGGGGGYNKNTNN